jgi:hypothetical protein
MGKTGKVYWLVRGIGRFCKLHYVLDIAYNFDCWLNYKYIKMPVSLEALKINSSEPVLTPLLKQHGMCVHIA